MKNFNWKLVTPHIVAFVLFLVLSVLYCKPALEGKIIEQHDVKEWKAMAQQSFVAKEKYGYFPMWTNSMFGGMPAYQIALDSRNNSIIHVQYFNSVLTLGLPKPAYYLFFCCLGFYFFAIILGIRPWLSIVGAIAYGYCSYNPILITAGHDTKLLSMAYAPAVLASILLIFKKKYWLGAAMLIVTTTCMMAQNHQQIVYYTLLMAVCLVIPFIYTTIKEKDYKHLISSIGLSLLAAILSLMACAVSYFPTYEYSQETMRGGGSGLTLAKEESNNKTKGGLNKDYAFSWSYGKLETLTLLIPNAVGGGSGTSLGDDSKVINLLQNEQGLQPQMGQQLAQAASAYWGAQLLGTSGPVYLGSFICVFALAGFLYSTNKNKWWLLAITLIGIVLAWGKNLAGVNYFLFDYLPFYKKFRAPSMSLVMAQLAIPAMAILYVNELLQLEQEKLTIAFKKLLYVVGGTAVVCFGVYAIASFSNENTDDLKKSLFDAMKDNRDFANNYLKAWIDDRKSLYLKDMLRSLGLIAVAVGLLFSYLKKWLTTNVVSIALIVLCIIDFLPIGKRYLTDDNFVDAEVYEQAYLPTAADAQLSTDTSFYRVVNLSVPYGNGTYGADISNSFNTAIASYRHNTIGGYHPAKLSIYEDLKNFQIIKNIQAWGANPNAKDSFPVLNMLNMKYVIVPNQQAQNKETVAILNPFALGNCWFIQDIKYVDNVNDEMTAMDNFNPANTVIINSKLKSIAGNNPIKDSTASIVFVENKNDYIQYKSTATTNQFAVFSEVYYGQGWNAYIDGKKVDYCKVNYALRGMPVPSGKHIIEFKFEPRLFAIGDTVSFVGNLLSVLLVFLFLFLNWKSRKNSTA